MAENHPTAVKVGETTGSASKSMNNDEQHIGKLKQYLVTFTYDAYCQGYEEATENRLVYASTFDQACNVIKLSFYNARDFQNSTLWVDGKHLA